MYTTKKTVLLLAGLICLGNILAQTPVVDSLKRKLSAHPQQDTGRVNLLNNLAIEIRRVDRTQMPTFVDEALKLAQKLNYTNMNLMRA